MPWPSAGGGGKAKLPCSSRLYQIRQAVAVPVEQLEAVAAFGAKHEEVAREWVGTKKFADHLGQAVERWRLMVTSVVG